MIGLIKVFYSIASLATGWTFCIAKVFKKCKHIDVWIFKVYQICMFNYIHSMSIIFTMCILYILFLPIYRI